MRNATATFDDLDDAPAPRKTAARKPRPSPSRGRKKAKRSRFDAQRVARFAAIGMAATMAVGIVVNALMLQKGHHPAPLFGKTSAISTVATKPAAPLPPPRATALAETAGPVPARSDATASAAIRSSGDDASQSDAIGRLLSGAAAASAGKTDGKIEGRTVIGAQKALTKLGFKVPATGTAGPATRKAIEAFEKDRHLPVKGDLSRRLVKVLAAESGIKID